MENRTCLAWTPLSFGTGNPGLETLPFSQFQLAANSLRLIAGPLPTMYTNAPVGSAGLCIEISQQHD